MNFIAIDFETAQPHIDPCEVGITIVREGQVKESRSWRIKPICYPDFHPATQRVHKIMADDVADSPTFDRLWPEIKHHFYEQQLIFAHNINFDRRVLLETLDYYKIEQPDFNGICSLEFVKFFFPCLPKYTLETICRLLGIELNFHKAGDDSLAVAQMMLRILSALEINANDEFVSYFNDQDAFTQDKKQNRNTGNSNYFQRGKPAKSTDSEQLVKYKGKKPDPESRFFGKLVVFACCTEPMYENYQEVIEAIGGTFRRAGVTKKTDFLVISDDYFSDLCDESKQTGKMRMAIKYKSQGVPIEIISTSEFLSEIPSEQC